MHCNMHTILYILKYLPSVLLLIPFCRSKFHLIPTLSARRIASSISYIANLLEVNSFSFYQFDIVYILIFEDYFTACKTQDWLLIFNTLKACLYCHFNSILNKQLSFFFKFFCIVSFFFSLVEDFKFSLSFLI